MWTSLVKVTSSGTPNSLINKKLNISKHLFSSYIIGPSELSSIYQHRKTADSKQNAHKRQLARNKSCFLTIIFFPTTVHDVTGLTNTHVRISFKHWVTGSRYNMADGIRLISPHSEIRQSLRQLSVSMVTVIVAPIAAQYRC